MQSVGKNPRVYVSLDPEHYARIDRVSKALGISRSKLVSLIIENHQEPLHYIEALMERLEDFDALPPEMRGDILRRVAIDNGQLALMEAEASEDLRTLISELDTMFDRWRAGRGSSRAERATGAVLPPSINKGAKTSSPDAPVPSKDRPN